MPGTGREDRPVPGGGTARFQRGPNESYPPIPGEAGNQGKMPGRDMLAEALGADRLSLEAPHLGQIASSFPRTALPEPPSQPRPSLPPPVLIEDEGGLERLMDDIAGEKEVAVDTEGDSFYHYEERVCLIQLSAAGKDYLIDPLKEFDLAPLGELLADESVTKIFHDGEYDVRILKRNYGFSFAGLFDTRVAAAALGYTSPGLAAVVERWFQVELDKSLQRSNWSKRPLTESQIDYARLDTHFLIKLKSFMLGELEKRGRAMIVEGECRRLEELEPVEREFQPDEFLRLKGARTLSLMQMQSLRELYVLRDKLARERDVPPFKVLGNPVIVDLARAQPQTLRHLERAQLSPKLIKRWGSPILSALKRAKRLGPLPNVPRLPPKDPSGHLDEPSVELHERLKNWRKKQAKAHEMDASLVLNRHVLVRLAIERPSNPEELGKVPGILDWQTDLFGEEILSVVKNFESDVAQGRLVFNGRPRRRNRRDS